MASRTQHIKERRLAAALAAVALAATLALCPTTPACADEAASSGSSSAATGATSIDSHAENLVDPTQRADNSFIYDTTIETLYEEAALYEGRTVQIVGEVVGDLIKESGTTDVWVTLTSLETDNPTSISVLMSEDQASQIDRFGRYGVTGTTLQVRGIYHQACSEHEGLPDIHATNSSVITRGMDHPDSVTSGDMVPGALTILIGFGLMAAYYFVRERSR